MPESSRKPMPDGNAPPESAAPHERPDSPKNVFVDVFMSLMKQWFGPVPDLNSINRFLCAVAGSVTFFIGFTLIALVEHLRLIIDSKFISLFLPLIVSFIILSALFARLVSWIDMGFGPIRLYMSGFLLPYIVWLLAVRLPRLEL